MENNKYLWLDVMDHNDKESWKNNLRQLYAYFGVSFDSSRSSQIFSLLVVNCCRLFWVVVSRCGFAFLLLSVVVGRCEPFFGLFWVVVGYCGFYLDRCGFCGSL